MVSLGPGAPRLELHPTRRCNLACAHCYSSSGPTVREALDVDVALACIEDAALLGYRRLTVSGGEPLLYEPLADVLTQARALGMQITIITNGMLAMSGRWARLAPLVDMVQISIDGTEPVHDAMRRLDGAFAAAIRNLEAIRASGIAFGFTFTLTRHNADCLEPVVRLAAEQGADTVEIQPLALHGRAAAALAGARPDGIALRFALWEAGRLGRTYGVAVRVDALGIERLISERERLVPATPVRELAAVAPVLVVGADASVLPLSYEVRPVLGLGSLDGRRLARLARDWLGQGGGDALADACARTWSELTAWVSEPAVAWYSEVARRTWPSNVQLPIAENNDPTNT